MTKKKVTPEAVEAQPVAVETLLEKEKVIIPTAAFEKNKADALRDLAEAVENYNKAARLKNLDDMNKYNSACVAAKNLYNDSVRTIFYAECCNKADPLLEAVKVHSYTGINFRDAKEEDCDFVIRKTYDAEYYVQLSAFNKYAEQVLGHSIGANKDWLHMIEKFTQLMTFYAAQEIGIDPKIVADTYAIRQIAKQIELGETPTSKTQIQKQLQDVVTAMLGESDGELNFKVLTHDAAFIRLLFAKKSRSALTLAASSPKEMNALVAQVCHRIVNGEDYRIEYRKPKL